MINWMTEELKNKVKSVFETRYKRGLTDGEVVAIAESLVGYMELAIKSLIKSHENKQN